MRLLKIVTIAALSLGVPAAFAADTVDKTKTEQRDYIQQAAMADMFEVESSKLALQKSRQNDVRDFAQMMVDDHTKSTDKLKKIVADKKLGEETPVTLDRKHADARDNLNKMTGAQFDRAFMAAQVDGHRDALKIHQDYAKSGSNPDLKAFAQETSKVVEQHLAHAQRVQRAIEQSAQVPAGSAPRPEPAPAR